MKSIYLFFCIILILFSCRSNIKNDLHDEKSTLLAKSKIIIDTNKDHQVNDTIRKGISKANKSIEFITIDQLDIATKDLGFFNSKQADIACQKLGDGWRLPNEDELNVIYEQNDKLGTFKTNYYLGLGYEPDAYNENGDVKMFLRISIINGEVVILQSDQELFSNYGVRAVRDHKL
jgi:hypothetical protein